MQELFSTNSVAIIERLQAKLRFQTKENQRLKEELTHLSRPSFKNLCQLMANRESSQQQTHIDTSSTTDGKNDTFLASRSRADSLEWLREEMCYLQEQLSEQRRLRSMAEGQALLCKQVLIEEQELSKELTKSYEERIVELLEQVRLRQQLLCRRIGRGANQPESSKAQYSQLYRQAQLEMLYKNMLRTLKLELEKERKDHQNACSALEVREKDILQLRQKIAQLSCAGLSKGQQKSHNELIMFDDEQDATLPQENLSLQLSDSCHVHKSGALGMPVGNPRANMPPSTEQLRFLLYKKSISEACLAQELTTLRSSLRDIKQSQQAISLANRSRDALLNQLTQEAQRYRRMLMPEKSNYSSEEGSAGRDRLSILAMARDLHKKLCLSRPKYRACRSISLPAKTFKSPREAQSKLPDASSPEEPFLAELSVVVREAGIDDSISCSQCFQQPF